MVVPLNGDFSYEVTQPFAKTLAELVAEQRPDRIVSIWPKRNGAERYSSIGARIPILRPLYVYAMRAEQSEPFMARAL
jgi:hypothetical protein